MIETDFARTDLWFMLQGAGMTLALTFWAVLGGTLLGLVLGLLRAISPWWINAALGGVLDVFRSIPLLIQFILANSFKSILGLNVSAFTVACVMLALYTSAYCTEIVRAGVLAVPATTRRASRSLGMTYWQDLRYIVFPIAPRRGRRRRVVYAFGHGHLGLTQATATARLVADIVAARAPPLDLAPFSPQRIGSARTKRRH